MSNAIPTPPVNPLPSSLRIGVLMVGPVQLLDVAAVDLFGMISKEYLATMHMDAILALARDVEIVYISESGKGSVSPTTAGAKIEINYGLSDAPALDILFIPGPDPFVSVPESATTYIKSVFASTSGSTPSNPPPVILSVCSGIIPLATTGLLDNRTATAPRGLLRALKKKYPKVTWIDKRWAVSDEGKKGGRIWTSGAVTNGDDMVSAFLRERIGQPIAGLVMEIADVGQRDAEYPGPLPEAFNAPDF